MLFVWCRALDARFLLIVACAVTLPTGCASYKPAPISAAQNADAIQARSLDNPQLQKFIVAATGGDDEWDRSGRLPPPPSWNLTRLSLAALFYHPNLDIARTKLAAARARVITAGQIPNPSLSFEELSYNTSVATLPPGRSPPSSAF
jgi:outer membrane protein, heavy metal efflux system